MKTQVQKWGNSLAMRIPSVLARQLELSEGSTISLEREGSSLVLRPVTPDEQLQDLIARITPEHLHPEAWSDEAHGQEVW